MRFMQVSNLVKPCIQVVAKKVINVQRLAKGTLFFKIRPQKGTLEALVSFTS